MSPFGWIIVGIILIVLAIVTITVIQILLHRWLKNFIKE